LAAALPGGGEGEGTIPAEFGPYLARLRQRIQESLTYPPAARRRGLRGTVHLEIELLPTGQVASVVIRAPSAHMILDEAAFEAVRRLPPVPFPPGVPSRALRVRLPIVFELR
jgi:protein TonB